MGGAGWPEGGGGTSSWEEEKEHPRMHPRVRSARLACGRHGGKEGWGEEELVVHAHRVRARWTAGRCVCRRQVALHTAHAVCVPTGPSKEGGAHHGRRTRRARCHAEIPCHAPTPKPPCASPLFIKKKKGVSSRGFLPVREPHLRARGAPHLRAARYAVAEARRVACRDVTRRMRIGTRRRGEGRDGTAPWSSSSPCTAGKATPETFKDIALAASPTAVGRP